jgi:hypothetical protein
MCLFLAMKRSIQLSICPTTATVVLITTIVMSIIFTARIAKARTQTIIIIKVSKAHWL